jgi:hypothetical protein
MNKKLLKQFREIATKLEVTFEKRIITVTGQQLIDTGNSIIDSQQINPELSYQIETQAPANHYRKLKEAYKFGGIKSCNDYIRSVNEVVQRANLASLEQTAGISERKEMFSI